MKNNFKFQIDINTMIDIFSKGSDGPKALWEEFKNQIEELVENKSKDNERIDALEKIIINNGGTFAYGRYSPDYSQENVFTYRRINKDFREILDNIIEDEKLSKNN